MKNEVITVLFVSGIILFTSCTAQYHSSTNKEFKSVKIGAQIWMAENLNTDTFSNGEVIQQARTSEEWHMAGLKRQPAWCYYKNKQRYGAKYGKLYNWFALNDPRGLAPQGWRIPTEEDWKELGAHLGGDTIAGLKLKTKHGWKQNGGGSNESNFNAMPGGSRSYILVDGYGIYRNIREYGMWWNKTRLDNEIVELAGYCVMEYDDNNLSCGGTSLEHGMSVRCIK